MKSRPLLALGVLCVACANPGTIPTEPSGIMTGTWRTGAVPSGVVTVLALRQVDAIITGNGADYSGAPSRPLEDIATASGRYADSTFDLRLRFQVAGSVRFVGSLVGTDVMHGTWTPPAPKEPFQIDFVRQPD
jgi:hypothetical protein